MPLFIYAKFMTYNYIDRKWKLLFLTVLAVVVVAFAGILSYYRHYYNYPKELVRADSLLNENTKRGNAYFCSIKRMDWSKSVDWYYRLLRIKAKLRSSDNFDFAMALATVSASADKVIKAVSLSPSSGETLERLVGDEKLTIDSLVVSGWPGKGDYAMMRTMCQEGRLRGFDLTEAHNEYIPVDAFYTGDPTEGQNKVKEVKLEYITLPKKLQGIRSRAFAGTHLRLLDISATLMDIADDAFSGCKDLKNVIIHSPYVPEKYIFSKVFDDIAPDAVLCVPQWYKANYEGDSRWKKIL